MREVNLGPIKSNNVFYYRYTYERLLEVAEKNKWLHELDTEAAIVNKRMDIIEPEEDEEAAHWNKIRQG